MSDLRQGVTPTQHAVLDLIEEQAPDWNEKYDDWEERFSVAIDLASDAYNDDRIAAKQAGMILAAAMLIDAADEIARLIDAPDEVA